MDVKRVGTGAAIVGALAAASLGIGSGVAAADETIPQGPAVTWKLDRPHPHPHWDDWGRWDDRRWNGWRGDPHWAGSPCAWVPPAVSAWVPPAVC